MTTVLIVISYHYNYYHYDYRQIILAPVNPRTSEFPVLSTRESHPARSPRRVLSSRACAVSPRVILDVCIGFAPWCMGASRQESFSRCLLNIGGLKLLLE